MTPEEIQILKGEMATIRESVNRIERALVGDSKLGQMGFAERLVLVEKKAEEHEKKIWLWSGMATGASVLLSKFWHQIVG